MRHGVVGMRVKQAELHCEVFPFLCLFHCYLPTCFRPCSISCPDLNNLESSQILRWLFVFPVLTDLIPQTLLFRISNEAFRGRKNPKFLHFLGNIQLL